MITRNWIKWPTGERLPGFFYGGVNRPAWLARNMRAWEHLRSSQAAPKELCLTTEGRVRRR